MSKTYQTLSAIAIWALFINGLVSILAPVIIGLANGSLAGTIFSVEDGLLWFYRHGLSFLIGTFSLAVFFYGLKAARQNE